jgi:hypothetical protein
VSGPNSQKRKMSRYPEKCPSELENVEERKAVAYGNNGGFLRFSARRKDIYTLRP